MGLLEKIGKAFVEEIPDTTDYNVPIEDMPSVYTATEVELEEVNTNTLIDDIYAQNDLADMSRSIFKVEELIASLPKEMATDTKRASVLAILGSFKLTPEEVIDDGTKRMATLTGVKDKVDSDCEKSIVKNEEQIEEFKKAIELLSVEIADEKTKMKASDELISNEIAKVEALIKFVGGEN